MRTVYLLAAVIGAVLPYTFFLGFFAAEGLALPSFIGALFANGAAAGFTVDLLVSSGVFWLWMFSRRAAGHPAPWLFVVVNLTIGLSCALPLYLWRDLALAETTA